MTLSENIRAKLCTHVRSKYYFQKVPVYLDREARTGKMPVFPLIILNEVNRTMVPHDVGGDKRYETFAVDVHFYAVNQPAKYMETIPEAFIMAIRANTITISGVDWINETTRINMPVIENEKIVAYHLVVTLEGEKYI